MLVRESIDTVLYHSPCEDGFAAAFVAHLFLMDGVEFIGLKPQEEPPSLKGKNVLAVDISWKRDVVERMNADADAFLILDHHKTAQEELKGLPYAVFDMNRSGVMLAWDYFYPKRPMPPFLHYIGMRDLWKHKGTEAELFCLGFNDTERTFDAYMAYYNESQLTEQAIAKGRAFLEYRTSTLELLASLATEHTWQGHTVLVINVGYPFTSDLGDMLTNGTENVAFMWTKKVGEPYGVSLRSAAPDGPDVGALAQFMGSGGHKHAAGFRTETLPEKLFD